MSERIMLCSGCGSKNKIGQGRGDPKCAACGKVLAIQKSAVREMLTIFKRNWGWILVATIIGYAYLADNSSSREKSTSQKQTATYQQPLFNEPVVFVKHGLIKIPDGVRNAPLGIKTSTGQNQLPPAELGG